MTPLTPRHGKSPKEKPIIFSAPMVRAILDGRKSMTRRLLESKWLKIVQVDGQHGPYWRCQEFRTVNGNHYECSSCGLNPKYVVSLCPYGKVGDRLWVREAISSPHPLDAEHRNFTGFYRASDAERKVKWRPSIHMPRWASRITLEITAVKVERLQDISEEDATAEGIPDWQGPGHTFNPTVRFHELWDSIHGPGAWALNPWVWCVSFTRAAPSASAIGGRGEKEMT